MNSCNTHCNHRQKTWLLQVCESEWKCKYWCALQPTWLSRSHSRCWAIVSSTSFKSSRPSGCRFSGERARQTLGSVFIHSHAFKRLQPWIQSHFQDAECQIAFAHKVSRPHFKLSQAVTCRERNHKRKGPDAWVTWWCQCSSVHLAQCHTKQPMRETVVIRSAQLFGNVPVCQKGENRPKIPVHKSERLVDGRQAVKSERWLGSPPAFVYNI